MKVHSNLLTYADLVNAVGELPGVYITAQKVGSRSHDHAFEFSLEGNGCRKNSGKYGASDQHGATWDEWGGRYRSTLRNRRRSRFRTGEVSGVCEQLPVPREHRKSVRRPLDAR